MPSGFEALPADAFYEIAELLPMNELLDLRPMSKNLNSLVNGYIKRIAESDRILDIKKGFDPIDYKTTSAARMLTGLRDGKMIRMLDRMGETEEVKRWDHAIRTAVRDNPAADKSLIASTLAGLAKAVAGVPGEPDSLARQLNEQLELRQALHSYAEYCLQEGLLVNLAFDQSFGTTVDPSTDIDKALDLWAKGDIGYDREKIP